MARFSLPLSPTSRSTPPVPPAHAMLTDDPGQGRTKGTGAAVGAVRSPVELRVFGRGRTDPDGHGGRSNPTSSASLGVWPLELQCEPSVDLQVAQQEGPFVESPAPQPAGDFDVALTGVA